MKKNILILLFFTSTLLSFGQEKSKDIYHSFGGQVGYFHSKTNQLDFGLNHYWTIDKFDNYHTFGPFISAVRVYNNTTNHFRLRTGINYHYGYLICPRINIAYENNFDHDSRLGADIGVSWLGLYLYWGYYYPIGKFEETGISRQRIGIRLIINLSLSQAGGNIG